MRPKEPMDWTKIIMAASAGSKWSTKKPKLHLTRDLEWQVVEFIIDELHDKKYAREFVNTLALLC